MDKRLLFLASALTLTLFLNIVSSYDAPIGPQPQKIGVATIIGCLPTIYDDETLLKVSLFYDYQKIKRGELCLLNGFNN